VQGNERLGLFYVVSATICSYSSTSIILCGLGVNILAETFVRPRSEFVVIFMLLLLLFDIFNVIEELDCDCMKFEKY